MNDIMHDNCKVHYIITTKILRHIALSLHNVPINSNTRSQIHWHEQGPLKYIDTKTLGIYEVCYVDDPSVLNSGDWINFAFGKSFTHPKCLFTLTRERPHTVDAPHMRDRTS